ncbi:MAG: hypothetical protein PUE01_12295 [Clostridiaceae bacterium]|nr:hypothetical protein [Clostridiaceae bacterium]
MKYKICLVLLFLFSFSLCNIGAYVDKKTSNDIENCINKVCDFCENGVKVEYKKKGNINKEIIQLKEKIANLYPEDDISICNNEINVSNDKKSIHALVYKEKNNISVEIELINKDKVNKLSILMQELTQLQDKKAMDIRYFQYVKGKINNVEDIKFNIKDAMKIKNIDTLNVHNGYVGKGNLYNGERVNFAISTYNTGTYLVIGTPIIFATY